MVTALKLLSIKKKTQAISHSIQYELCYDGEINHVLGS